MIDPEEDEEQESAQQPEPEPVTLEIHSGKHGQTTRLDQEG